jgi:hypothetical protein
MVYLAPVSPARGFLRERETLKPSIAALLAGPPADSSWCQTRNSRGLPEARTSLLLHRDRELRLIAVLVATGIRAAAQK